jgi:hypothetical protein
VSAAGPTAAAADRAPRHLGDPLRAALVLGTGVSVALHARMALDGAHGRGWSVLMGFMALLCLPCLLALLRPGAAHPAARTVRMALGTALAMALGHVLLLPLLSHGAGHVGHGAPPAGTMPAAGGGAGHGSGVLAVVGVEMAVAVLAVVWLRRAERPTYRSV